MSRRIKVLQLQPLYNVRQHRFADLAEQIVLGLPRERYEVVSGYLHGRPAEGGPASFAERTVCFDFAESQTKGIRLRAMWRLYRYCRQERFDVVICHRFKSVNMFMWLNRLLRIPRCIGISHGFGEYDRGYRRWQARLLIDERWRFVGVSAAVRQYLIECACGFTAGNTVAIMNAIDTAEAEALQLGRGEARRLLGLPPGARVVGSIGRLVPVKGQVHLVRAFAAIAQRFPDAHLAIIGEGRQRPILEEQIARLGLAHRVHLLGAHEHAMRLVRAFDIFAMPSLREGLGLALLEAMSGRLPVIGSDIPAMRPLLLGAGGLLVAPGDEQGLAAALADYLLLADAELLGKGEQAYAYLLANHSIEAYRRAYQELIDGKMQAPRED